MISLFEAKVITKPFFALKYIFFKAQDFCSYIFIEAQKILPFCHKIYLDLGLQDVSVTQCGGGPCF